MERGPILTQEDGEGESGEFVCLSVSPLSHDNHVTSRTGKADKDPCWADTSKGINSIHVLCVMYY